MQPWEAGGGRSKGKFLHESYSPQEERLPWAFLIQSSAREVRLGMPTMRRRRAAQLRGSSLKAEVLFLFGLSSFVEI